MSNKSSENKQKWVYRILAIILALLMVVGPAYYLIAMLTGNL